MKKALLTASAFTAIFSCFFLYMFPNPVNSERSETLDLSDKNTELVLVKNPNQGHISRLDLQIDGQLDGEAIVIKGNSRTSSIVSDTISNEVHLNLNGDWYQDTCYLLVQPLTYKSG